MKRFTSLLSALALLFTVSLTFAQSGPTQYRVDNINALLQITLYGSDAKVTAWAGGGSARDDGLGGMFFYDGNSSAATNTYAVFKPVNNAGRWWKLPTSVAYQTAVMNPSSETTAAWTLLRGGQTNFLGIGADNSYAYVQSFSSKVLQINPVGNNTLLNSGGGNVGIRTTGPVETLDVSVGAVKSARLLMDSTAFNPSPSTASTDGSDAVFAAVSGNTAGGSASQAGSSLVLQSGIGTGAGANGDIIFKLASSTANNGANTRHNGPAEYVRIQSVTGNFGIGTPSPTSLLSVGGAAAAGTIVATNGITVGSVAAAQQIVAIYSGVAQIDFPSIAVGGWTNMPITVTGAGTNSVVSVSAASGAPAAGVLFTAYVSATNTVQISGGNVTLTAIDPATTSYRVTVFQY